MSRDSSGIFVTKFQHLVQDKGDYRAKDQSGHG